MSLETSRKLLMMTEIINSLGRALQADSGDIGYLEEYLDDRCNGFLELSESNKKNYLSSAIDMLINIGAIEVEVSEITGNNLFCLPQATN
jgi:hypothetical protein